MMSFPVIRHTLSLSLFPSLSVPDLLPLPCDSTVKHTAVQEVEWYMQADTQGVLSAQSFHAEAPVNPFAPSDAPFLAPHASTSDNVAKALSGLPAEPVVPQNTDAVHGTLFAGTPLRSLFPDNVAKALAGLHIEQVDPQGTAIVDSSCSAAFPRAQSQPLDVTSAIYELNGYQTVSESATSVPQARRRKHVVRRVAQAPVCPHNEPTLRLCIAISTQIMAALKGRSTRLKSPLWRRVSTLPGVPFMQDACEAGRLQRQSIAAESRSAFRQCTLMHLPGISDVQSEHGYRISGGSVDRERCGDR